MTSLHPYALPHPADRPGQAEAIEWCMDVEGTAIIEAFTGSGKTSFAAGTASRKRVIATCATKNLQQENYGDGYNFDILYGKNNACYECVYTDVLPGTNPSNCRYSNKLHKCPKAATCTYQVQKHRCQTSRKTSLNNAYYLSAMWPKESPPDVLFLDEAHELHSFVTRWAGCTIGIKEQLEWSLPPFPTIMHLVPNTLLRLGPPVDLAVPWLIRARATMRSHYHSVKAASTDSKADRERLQRCENLGRKIDNTLQALRLHRSDWYVRSTPGIYNIKVGRDGIQPELTNQPEFICKPLTARYHFADYFLSGAKNVIMMSATIGNVASFTEEVGLSDYQFKSIPSRFPPEVRPVRVLDIPSMGSRATDIDFDKQALEIANLIKSVDHSWSGLVHVTRKSEAAILARRLSKHGLGERVWPFTGHDGNYRPTNQQVADWRKRLAKVPNSIGVGWSVGTGYDGVRERINIIAKTPYPIWGGDGTYEQAWRSYSHTRYLWQTACDFMQRAGRTRRGHVGNYDMNGNINGVVAIADGSWTGIKGQLPEDFLDSVIEM